MFLHKELVRTTVGFALTKLWCYCTSKIAERALLAGELSPQSCYILPYLSRRLHILQYGRTWDTDACVADLSQDARVRVNLVSWDIECMYT
jgi:hypothetical protein